MSELGLMDMYNLNAMEHVLDIHRATNSLGK